MKQSPLSPRALEWAFLLLLLALLGVAGAQLVDPAGAALPGLGLLVVVLAPLGFLIRIRLAPPRDKRHPVVISVLIGLGCAMIMVGIQRFGDQYNGLLALALLTLICWMLYQRYVWRSDGSQR